MDNMQSKNMNKCSYYLCCSLDLTIATRIIAFIGILISMILMAVLVNDKLVSGDDLYEVSRTTALALGLDWKHFHENASVVAHHDPEGTMVSIITVFYSMMFLFTNLLLLFGSLKCEWYCALPWLLCEFFSCLSKFGALIFHFNCKPFHMSNIFIVGSVIYIAVMVWWWIVVFLAQKMWRCTKQLEIEIELDSHLPEVPEVGNTDRKNSLSDSPLPYVLNVTYKKI